MSEWHENGLPETTESYEGYLVYDLRHEKVGKVNDLFTGGDGRVDYVGVKIGGLLGTKHVLIPAEAIRVNLERRLLQVGADREEIESGPTYDDPKHVTLDFEDKVLAYYEAARHEEGYELGPDVVDLDSRRKDLEIPEEQERRRREEVGASSSAVPEIQVRKKSHVEESGGQKAPSSGRETKQDRPEGREGNPVRVHHLQRGGTKR